MDENRLVSFSFLGSPPGDFFAVSLRRSSSNLTSARSITMLSRPFCAPSIDVCKRSRRVLSCAFSVIFGILLLAFLDSSSFFLLSFSSEPRSHVQLDFRPPSPSFLSFDFFESDLLLELSNRAGIEESVSVLVLLPGSAAG